jgi:hypothetical protein
VWWQWGRERDYERIKQRGLKKGKRRDGDKKRNHSRNL